MSLWQLQLLKCGITDIGAGMPSHLRSIYVASHQSDYLFYYLSLDLVSIYLPSSVAS